jgi:flagellar motility protein MotE (MotC chaperone)
MKRSKQLFLGGLVLAKTGVVALLLWAQGGELLFFQREAGAVETPQRSGETDVKEPGATATEPANMKALLRLKVEIEKERERLQREREDLLAIREDINKKLTDLSQIRNEIRAQMEAKKSIEEQRMKHLVKAYAAMKPQAAAGLIERLDLAFAVDVLSRMQGDTVGSILSFVDKEKAARICQGLVKSR